MFGVFVTATGTEVGKTFVTAGLIRACNRAGLAARALKPVSSGFDPAEAAGSDAGVLLAAMGQPITPVTVAAVAPWRFAAPLSPHMAAQLEGRELDFEEVVRTCQTAVACESVTFVEGVGGVMVPLDGRHTVLDLMARLRLPILVVSGTGLGAISHCLTAVAALAGRGLAPRAILLNGASAGAVPLTATTDTIRSFCRDIPVATIEQGATDESFDRLLADLELDKAFPTARDCC